MIVLSNFRENMKFSLFSVRRIPFIIILNPGNLFFILLKYYIGTFDKINFVIKRNVHCPVKSNLDIC